MHFYPNWKYSVNSQLWIVLYAVGDYVLCFVEYVREKFKVRLSQLSNKTLSLHFPSKYSQIHANPKEDAQTI